MKCRKAALVVAALAATFTGCSEQLSSPVSDNATREILVQRVHALKDSVTAVGRMTPDQERELDDIKADIEAWHARTGRNDLRVSSSRPSSDAVATASLTRGPTNPSCLPCPPVKVFGNQICFLRSSYCGAPGDLISRACQYDCVFTTA